MDLQQLREISDPVRFVGRAPEQVDRFLAEWVQPALVRLETGANERLGEPGLALETYYTVIDFENLNEGEKESEWYYFYECAFKAIQILETGRPRWQATLDILRKVEDSGSPWSADARKQREHLKLKHQLFDAE